MPYLGNSFAVSYANETRTLLEQFQHMADPGLGVYAGERVSVAGGERRVRGRRRLRTAPDGKARAMFGDFCLLKVTQGPPGPPS
jgi:hypothetical protein